MKSIKLNARLNYGTGEDDFYAAGSVLTAEHFPEATFKEHPERVMMGLVMKGHAVIHEDVKEVPKTPAVKESEKMNEKTGGKK